MSKQHNHTGSQFYRDLGKRVFDIVATMTASLLLFPIALIITVLVYLFHGFPILFRQQRPGQHGIPFTIYKFRTMTNKRDENGDLFPDHIRLTRFGQFLRRSSLDELPEFWNVLLGDMSLVGPRPLLMEYLNLYTPTQMYRHNVKPGITGWAQINGRNTLRWEEKFAFDIWYVDHLSFRLDAKILLQTVKTTLSREGISHEGEATMPNFTGSDPQ